jgi:regulator of replication initiation timing
VGALHFFIGDVMNWEFVLTTLVGFAAGSVTPIALHFLNRRNLTNQTNADVMNKIAAGGGAAVTAVIQVLNELQEDNAHLRLELSRLRTEQFEARTEIDAITESRRLRDIETQTERDELKARIHSDLMETQKLREDNTQLQAQVGKLEELAIKTGEYMDRVVVEAKANGWKLPMNGELWDSVQRLRLSREERRKLQGKQ